MRTIPLQLSNDSIRDAISEINDYKNEIMEKLNDYVDALVKEGKATAEERVSSAQGDSVNVSVDAFVQESDKNSVLESIDLIGEDCVFIEFGAGIHYNNGNGHPLAGQFGFGVGTYPSEHPPNRAINPGYWYYKGDDGNLHLSLGTEATMPLYSAGETMREKAAEKASEVFKL